MAKREFLLLAHDFVPKKHMVCGWYMSEKLDGMRCFWDGGVTRGMFKSDVPWANVDRDARYKERQHATGLWSRYGHVIQASEEWLDQLPLGVPLDGELYAPGKTRQWLFSVLKKLKPYSLDWELIKYFVFDIVPYGKVFARGLIKNTQYEKQMDGCYAWVKQRIREEPTVATFDGVVKVGFKRYKVESDVVRQHVQVELPHQTDKALSLIDAQLNEVTDAGGEGLILRNPRSLWLPERSHHILKVKKLRDDEGVVVGYTTGRETDKGSKLLGMMGALIVKYQGNKFELSGFSDDERRLSGKDDSTSAQQWATDNPGAEVPSWIQADEFPRGSKVTFRYRTLSDSGIPVEARYLRRKQDE